jgi:hypothetical protein
MSHVCACFLYVSLLIKIHEDITLQSQKYSSALVEAYDIIEGMWKQVYEYYSSVRAILEVSSHDASPLIGWFGSVWIGLSCLM